MEHPFEPVPNVPTAPPDAPPPPLPARVREVTQDEGTDTVWKGAVLDTPSGEVRVGPWVSTLAGGNFRTEGTYVAGRRHGVWRRWTDDRLEESTTYAEDMREGPAWETYPDGTIRREGTYHADREHGRWREYAPDGALLRDCEYRDGTPQGPCWFAVPADAGTEARSAHGSYVDGARSGRWTWSRADGSPLREADLLFDVQHGTERAYDAEGRVTEEIEYRYGRRHGEWRTADGASGWAYAGVPVTREAWESLADRPLGRFTGTVVPALCVEVTAPFDGRVISLASGELVEAEAPLAEVRSTAAEMTRTRLAAELSRWVDGEHYASPEALDVSMAEITAAVKRLDIATFELPANPVDLWEGRRRMREAAEHWRAATSLTDSDVEIVRELRYLRPALFTLSDEKIAARYGRDLEAVAATLEEIEYPPSRRFALRHFEVIVWTASLIHVNDRGALRETAQYWRYVSRSGLVMNVEQSYLGRLVAAAGLSSSLTLDAPALAGRLADEWERLAALADTAADGADADAAIDVAAEGPLLGGVHVKQPLKALEERAFSFRPNASAVTVDPEPMVDPEPARRALASAFRRFEVGRSRELGIPNLLLDPVGEKMVLNTIRRVRFAHTLTGEQQPVPWEPSTFPTFPGHPDLPEQIQRQESEARLYAERLESIEAWIDERTSIAREVERIQRAMREVERVVARGRIQAPALVRIDLRRVAAGARVSAGDALLMCSMPGMRQLRLEARDGDLVLRHLTPGREVRIRVRAGWHPPLLSQVASAIARRAAAERDAILTALRAAWQERLELATRVQSIQAAGERLAVFLDVRIPPEAYRIPVPEPLRGEVESGALPALRVGGPEGEPRYEFELAECPLRDGGVAEVEILPATAADMDGLQALVAWYGDEIVPVGARAPVAQTDEDLPEEPGPEEPATEALEAAHDSAGEHGPADE